MPIKMEPIDLKKPPQGWPYIIDGQDCNPGHGYAPSTPSCNSSLQYAATSNNSAMAR